jgi:hypothetical protein
VKTLAYDEVISIGTADDSQIVQGGLLLTTARTDSGDDIRRMMDKGHLHANTITVHGIPGYIVYWRKLQPDCLDIMGASQLPGVKGDFAQLVEGCEQIATRHNCSYAVFHSTRKGMAPQIIKHGGKVHSVCFVMPNRKFKA